MHELNRENISITHANYAEGNGDFNNAAPFVFQVMAKAMSSVEKEIIAQFNDKNDAKLFIIGKIKANKTIHDNELFFIFKGKILIDTVSKIIITNREKESCRSSGNEKGSTLSPLPMRPTPGGGPADYWVERRDDDE